jgi:hypothetical protein
MVSSSHGLLFSWSPLLMVSSSHGLLFSWSPLLMVSSSHGLLFSWSPLLMVSSSHGFPSLRYPLPSSSNSLLPRSVTNPCLSYPPPFQWPAFIGKSLKWPEKHPANPTPALPAPRASIRGAFALIRHSSFHRERALPPTNDKLAHSTNNIRTVITLTTLRAKLLLKLLTGGVVVHLLRN